MQKADARFYPPDFIAVIRASNGKPQTGKVFTVTKSGVIVYADGKLCKVRTPTSTS